MKLICAFLGLILPFLGTAQLPTVSFSQESEFRDEGKIIRVGDFYYRNEVLSPRMQLGYTAKLRKALHGIELHKYDLQMKKLKSVEWSDGDRAYGPVYPFFFQFGDKLLVVYYSYPSEDTVKAYLAEIDKETLQPSNTREIYAYYQKNDNIGLGGTMEGASPRIFYSLSPNQKKILLRFRLTGDPDNISVRIVDTDLSLSEILQIPVPDAYVKWAVQQSAIDDSGNIICTASYIEDRQKKVGVLMRRADGVVKSQFFDTGTDDKVPAYLWIKFIPDSTKVYLFANYHSIANDENYSEGFITASLNLTDFTLSQLQLTPYPEDIIARIDKLGFSLDAKKKLYVRHAGMQCTDFGDGSFLLTGFPSFAGSGVSSSGRNMKPAEYVGPVIVVAVSEGKSTIRMLPRNISSFNGAHPLVWKNGEDGIYCFYTDSERNSKDNLNANPYYQNNASDFVMVLAKIKKDGTILSREKISDDPPGKGTFFISRFQQTGPDTFVFPVGKDRVNLMGYFTEITHMATLQVR